jgi:hypothetical protein
MGHFTKTVIFRRLLNVNLSLIKTQLEGKKRKPIGIAGVFFFTGVETQRFGDQGC